jgi:hypothetical protein
MLDSIQGDEVLAVADSAWRAIIIIGLGVILIAAIVRDWWRHRDR